MNPSNSSDTLLISVENIQALRAREESEEASDGGGTGRSDTNDVVTIIP
ncbi:MAG: hypothetical protein K2P90_00205 [Holosporales bacterium]|jgi:hypothetical protein|nr:hypothetical protein [Holosporales bacterium]